MADCVIDHGVKRAETHAGLLCGKHRRQLDEDGTEVGVLWCELNLILDGCAPRDASPKTRHLKSAEAPAPIDLTAAALRDPRSSATRLPGTPANPAGDQSDPIPPVPHVVASWLTLVADERPLTQALPRGVVPQLALLRTHHDWAAEQDWVADYLTEIHDLRKALRMAVRDETHKFLGTCDMATDTTDACGGALLSENGSGVIRCSKCRTTWETPQEQARLAVRLESA